ncbi:MAG: division/cell wall cluster transcriptional repressor MraZ [Chloroflexi bacterium]|nr:division/cell wall cluster transcriptional repressor MraZ [Chloroflexota bacterium]
MFLGEFAHNLDAKGRLTIPVRFRAELANGLVIARGYEPCLVLYPTAVWNAIAAKLAQTPMASRQARSYGRLLFGGASEASLDKMGRILIPVFLREHAGLDQEAILVGINTYVEIWSPERWRQVLERDAGNQEEILGEMARLGI